MLDGPTVAVNPVDGETDAENVTVPVNPLRLVAVILELALCPATKLSDVGLAVRPNPTGEVIVKPSV